MSRSDFTAGLRDVLPFIPGFVPLGILTGVAARELGLSAIEATGMSAMIFAGLSQLTAIELLSQGAPLWVVAVSALMLNLRFSMFSAALEPHLRSISRARKWIAGFLVSTPAFVLSVTRFDSDRSTDHFYYYLGAAIPIYLNWVLSSATGAVIGARVPPELQLDFIIPLVFLAMLFELLKGWASIITASSAGLIAILAVGIPFNLGLIVAAIVGTTIGMLSDQGGDIRDAISG